MNGSGSSIYEWITDIPPAYGCTSTDDICVVFMGTTWLEAQVRITQNGQSRVLNVSQAEIPAICWVDGMPVFC